MELAATRLIAMRKNKGKSIAACLHDHTSYIQNPDKTEQGELVSSYQCSPLTVDEEFMLTKRLYEQTTGRRQKSDVIAYQVRQSFRPGEVTPEEANRIETFSLSLQNIVQKLVTMKSVTTCQKSPDGAAVMMFPLQALFARIFLKVQLLKLGCAAKKSG